jgi:DNA-binding transcriptional MerR regulator/methylmalonyl-CoA mutase cobalamin-binding subunit
MYSIKAVAQATGLTVETLRAWERRYSVVVPLRDPTGRRVYRPEDVVRLRRLREATERGHPISRLASLSEDGLAQLLADAPARVEAASNAFVDRILEAAQQFRIEACEQAVTLAVALLPARELVNEVLSPLLREVGERWHRGEFSIAQERLVTTCVRRHVGVVLETYDRSARKQGIVFATLPGERHELGLLMSAMICANRGFKCHYLGADLPGTQIAQYSREVSAAVVALSVVMQESTDEVPAQLRELSAGLGSGVLVWIGGAASSLLPRHQLPHNCVVVGDQAELGRRLDLLHAA